MREGCVCLDMFSLPICPGGCQLGHSQHVGPTCWPIVGFAQSSHFDPCLPHHRTTPASSCLPVPLPVTRKQKPLQPQSRSIPLGTPMVSVSQSGVLSFLLMKIFSSHIDAQRMLRPPGVTGCLGLLYGKVSGRPPSSRMTGSDVCVSFVGRALKPHNLSLRVHCRRTAHVLGQAG